MSVRRDGDVDEKDGNEGPDRHGQDDGDIVKDDYSREDNRHLGIGAEEMSELRANEPMGVDTGPRSKIPNSQDPRSEVQETRAEFVRFVTTVSSVYSSASAMLSPIYLLHMLFIQDSPSVTACRQGSGFLSLVSGVSCFHPMIFVL